MTNKNSYIKIKFLLLILLFLLSITSEPAISVLPGPSPSPSTSASPSPSPSASPHCDYLGDLMCSTGGCTPPLTCQIILGPYPACACMSPSPSATPDYMNGPGCCIVDMANQCAFADAEPCVLSNPPPNYDPRGVCRNVINPDGTITCGCITLSVCGNGAIDPGSDEICDPPGSNMGCPDPGTACSADCKSCPNVITQHKYNNKSKVVTRKGKI